MAKSKSPILLPDGVCSDYELQDSGVIKIARCFPSLDSPWQKGARIPDYLSLVDHSFKMDKRDYAKAISKEEERLNLLVRRMQEQRISLIVALQGRDGAGKTRRALSRRGRRRGGRRRPDSADEGPKEFGGTQGIARSPHPRRRGHGRIFGMVRD